MWSRDLSDLQREELSDSSILLGESGLQRIFQPKRGLAVIRSFIHFTLSVKPMNQRQWSHLWPQVVEIGLEPLY